jgi:outer membrane protein assembly factor BamB
MEQRRRDYLRLCGGAFLTTVAGCVADSGPDDGATSTETTGGPSSTEATETAETSTTEEEPADLDPTWTASSFEGDVRDLVLADDALYASLSGGGTVALDAATGETLWQTDVTGTLDGSLVTKVESLTLASGTLFLTAAARDEPREYVHALDAATGETLWTYSAREFLSVAGVVGDTAYLGAEYIENPNPGPEQDPAGEGRVRALSMTDGATTWRRTVEDLGGVAVADHGVYATDGDQLRGFSHSGDRLWMVPASDHAGPVVTDRAVVALGRDGALTAYEPDTGAERWTVLQSEPSTTRWSDLVVTADRILLGGNSIASVTHDGTLAWRGDSGGRVNESLVTTNSVYADGGVEVPAYARPEGTRRWTYSPDDEQYVQATAAVEAGVMVHEGIGGDYQWHLLDAESGTPRAVLRSGLPFYATASRRNRLYVGSSGRVHAVDVPEK